MRKLKNVLQLKPTQFAVGMLEVDEKIKLAKSLNRKSTRKFIRENPVPVVKSHDGLLYVVDKHHFLAACYHLGIKKVKVEIVRELPKMSFAKFWSWMSKHRSAYPYCQFGEGPRNAIYLPRDIRGVADDPYRSLAWFVRKAGGFENSEKNFAEFQWANFFRSKKLLDRSGLAGLERALVKAVALAQSKEAAKLPGYGKLNLARKKKVVASAKKKIKEVRRQKKVENGDA